MRVCMCSVHCLKFSERGQGGLIPPPPHIYLYSILQSLVKRKLAEAKRRNCSILDQMPHILYCLLSVKTRPVENTVQFLYLSRTVTTLCNPSLRHMEVFGADPCFRCVFTLKPPPHTKWHFHHFGLNRFCFAFLLDQTPGFLWYKVSELKIISFVSFLYWNAVKCLCWIGLIHPFKF